jgi:hypothetical protein
VRVTLVHEPVRQQLVTKRPLELSIRTMVFTVQFLRSPQRMAPIALNGREISWSH